MTFKEHYKEYANNLRASSEPDNLENTPYLEDLERMLKECRLMNKETSILRSNEYAKQVQGKLVQWMKQDFWKKEHFLRITNHFFDCFIDDWCNSSDHGKFLTSDKFYDDSELDIKLLKYLQSGEDETIIKTRDAIQEHFCISDTTLKKHLSKLQNGYNLLGQNVKIEELRRVKNTYDSTLHPVFMALDLSDVYFLSIVLPRLAKDTMYSESARKIAALTHNQLSEYARKVIDPVAQKEGLNYNYPSTGWQEDLTYYEKSGKPCVILYGDSEEPLTGHFEMFSEENFVLDTGERMRIDYRKIIEVRKPE